MNESRPAVIAHRGASRSAAENTLHAFRLAGTMGADAVELDVRRTRDGALVVHHDPMLRDGRAIIDCATSELPPEVPRFAAALDACAGMWVNVEIKNDPSEPDFDASDSIADQTMSELLARGEPERWLISSFRMETVDRCRSLADRHAAEGAAPAIRTAWLTSSVPDDVADLLVCRGHAALHPWVVALTASTVDACHEAGLQVNTWTCDDPARMVELIEWGVDGICTNVPDIALIVRGGRGAPT